MYGRNSVTLCCDSLLGREIKMKKRRCRFPSQAQAKPVPPRAVSGRKAGASAQSQQPRTPLELHPTSKDWDKKRGLIEHWSNSMPLLSMRAPLSQGVSLDVYP